MKIKRFTALFLSVVMTVSLLSGCGRQYADDFDDETEMTAEDQDADRQDFRRWGLLRFTGCCRRRNVFLYFVMQ